MLDEGNVPKDTPNSQHTGYKYEGKEIVAIRRVGRPPTPPKNPEYYSQTQKLDAATLYCVYGDVKEVAKLSDIPENIIRGWKEEPWWIEVQKKVFVEQNDRLSSRISGVLDKAIDEIADRLENGDQTYNPKTGSITRKPIEARVLASLFETLSHQRRLTRGEPTSLSAKVGTDSRLEKLEEAFIRFSQAVEVVEEAKTIEHTEEKNGTR